MRLPLSSKPIVHRSALLGCWLVCSLLAGCALESTAPPTASSGAAIRGRVHGGQQPVVGSHVHVMAAGVSGYGGASTSLLTTHLDGTDAIGGYVTTDSSGSFNISGDYTCTAGTQVYLLATQGNPGLTPGSNNAALAMMTALGQCPAAGNFAATVPYVWINEITTVDSVYALSGFITDLSHVSSSGTALAQTGIANAFATAGKLFNVATGNIGGTTYTVSLGYPHGETFANVGFGQTPTALLADILAACINSDGTVSGPSSPTACYKLFANAMNGSTQPTDTVTAMANIVHNPNANVAALCGIATGIGAPYTAGPCPSAFILSLVYPTGAAAYPSTPASLAIDRGGNVWVGNFTTTGNFIQDIYISATGTTSRLALGNGQGYAIDSSSNAWITSGSNFYKIDSTGAILLTSGTVNAGNVVLDAAGNVWGTNFNNLSEVSGTTATQLSPYVGWSYQAGGLSHATAIAIDAAGHAWVSQSSGPVCEISTATGSPVSLTGYTGAGISGISAIAVDGSGNIWVSRTASLSELNGSTGAPISTSSGYTGGGLGANNAGPSAIAIDGAGNVWTSNGAIVNIFTNTYDGNLSEFSNTGTALSPSTGYAAGVYYQGIAIDGSGNVWSTEPQNNAVIELVGAATPVVTPLSAGVQNNTIASRP